MGSRLGYEYRCRFWMEDEITSLYQVYRPPRSRGFKSFLFEIRTNFIVRGYPAPAAEDAVVDEMMLDSERYDACILEDEGDVSLVIMTRYRLKEYWMTEDEIISLSHEAMDFARQMAADHPQLHVIPVVVGLDVCTVQQEGEPLVGTMDRAIRAEHLLPQYLWPFGAAVERKPMDTLLGQFLRNLPRIRVEDIQQGLALMPVCGLCGRSPSIGAQISVLQRCGHAFHSLCVVRWLENSELCPLCDVQAHDHICWAARASNHPLP